MGLRERFPWTGNGSKWNSYSPPSFHALAVRITILAVHLSSRGHTKGHTASGLSYSSSSRKRSQTASALLSKEVSDNKNSPDTRNSKPVASGLQPRTLPFSSSPTRHLSNSFIT